MKSDSAQHVRFYELSAKLIIGIQDRMQKVELEWFIKTVKDYMSHLKVDLASLNDIAHHIATHATMKNYDVLQVETVSRIPKIRWNDRRFSNFFLPQHKALPSDKIAAIAEKAMMGRDSEAMSSEDRSQGSE